jgi:hypothetical protein
MKVIFIEIYYKNWDKIDNGVVYETTDIQIPVKGNIIYINDKTYEVKNVSYHLYTDELKENYVKVELFSFK